MIQITLDMTIEEIVKTYPKAAQSLAQSGMNCVSCASASGETLEEAAESHGVDPVILVRKLNLQLNM